MLDTLSLVQLIQQQGRIHQSRYQEQKDTARSVWQQLIHHNDLQQQLMQKNIIGFTQPINTSYNADVKSNHYAACGIDGSQIYPDRHEGFSEYLINVGTAHFMYNTVSDAELKSKPYLFSGFERGVMVTPEFVNAQRTDYELKHAVEVSRHASAPVIMFDGALMFWHLQTPTMQERFLQNYLDYLAILHAQNTQYLGYISASHSCELVTLLKHAAELMGISAVFDHLVDTDVAEFFLKENQYTQVFAPISDLSDLYPAPLRPCFIYLHVGSEIARIEMPAYIAANQEKIAYLVSLVLDQVRKGNGYPVALSEAHEQAVVKAADRDFFYTMLQMHHQQKDTISLKLSKKRSAAV
jgi:hypothetical protein